MKWQEFKNQNGKVEKIQGTKNGIIFLIYEYKANLGRTHLGWYVVSENTITKEIKNTLMTNLSFKTIDEAKLWCENSID